MTQVTDTLRFASALSTAEKTSAAVEEVCARLAAALPGPADLVAIFATAHHAAGLWNVGDELSQALRPKVVLGLTAGGVIGPRQEVEQSPGLSVLAAKLPGVTLRGFVLDADDWDGLENEQILRDRLSSYPGEARVALVFADPFTTPLVRLLPAVGAALPGAPVSGGMASAAREPGGNRLLLGDRLLRQGTVGVTLGGPLRVDCTVSQGCRPIGKPYLITKSQRHVVHQLGGRKALEVIRELADSLDEQDRELVATQGLLVGRVIDEYKERFGRGDFLIRGLVGVDQDAGYVAIGDPQVRTGQTVQFHVRDQKTAFEDFALLLEAQKLYGPAQGALLFSCNGRGTHLFDEPNTDATLVSEALGDVPLAGFFAAGEIGPVGGQAFVHGHTASLVVFRPPEPTG